MEYDQVNAAFKASVKEYSDKLSKVKAKVEVPPEKIQKEVVWWTVCTFPSMMLHLNS